MQLKGSNSPLSAGSSCQEFLLRDRLIDNFVDLFRAIGRVLPGDFPCRVDDPRWATRIQLVAGQRRPGPLSLTHEILCESA